MHRLVRTCLATALVATALGAAAGPASAERWWGRDRAGDVTQYRYLPDPPPCGTVRETPTPDDTTTDLVGLGVHHEHGVVELRAQFRDLTNWGERSVSFELGTTAGRFDLFVTRSTRGTRAGTLVAQLYKRGRPGPVDTCGTFSVVSLGLRCDHLALGRSPARDLLTVAVPRRCLDSPRWVRVGASVHRQVGQRARSDIWGTPVHQDGTGSYEAATSPRIRHTP